LLTKQFIQILKKRKTAKTSIRHYQHDLVKKQQKKNIYPRKPTLFGKK